MEGRDVHQVDSEIFEAIRLETEREHNKLELIASENFCSEAVLDALGSVLTNKYAEGFPYVRDKEGKPDYSRDGRYYGGCEYVNWVEKLAIERAQRLFGCDHANVQAHSGTQANMTAYFTFAGPGDTILGLNLAHGGHLSHGHPVNFSGRMFTVVSYGVDPKTELLDYGQIRALAREHKPKIIISGASAYSRIISFDTIQEIANEVGAVQVSDIAHIAGLVAAGLHPSPVPYADVVTTTTHKTLRGPRGALVMCKEKHAAALDKSTFPGLQGGPLMHVIAAKAVCLREAMSDGFKTYQRQVLANARTLADELVRLGYRIVAGGTDNHLMLVDLRSRNVTGKDAERALGRSDITVNRNAIPFDPQKPFIASGIRLGTPALTTRGMKEPEMKTVAALIDRTLTAPGDATVSDRVRQDVQNLCDAFPLYPERRRCYANLMTGRK